MQRRECSHCSAHRATLRVEVRPDFAGALLTSELVRQDKTVEILPRWGEPVVITFVKRGSVPHLLNA